jgi:beta-glucanase (GH16 family)
VASLASDYSAQGSSDQLSLNGSTIANYTNGNDYYGNSSRPPAYSPNHHSTLNQPQQSYSVKSRHSRQLSGCSSITSGTSQSYISIAGGQTQMHEEFLRQCDEDQLAQMLEGMMVSCLSNNGIL